MHKGDRLGHYEIEGRLGAGAMGVVYRATDLRLHRQVAIKCLNAEVADDPDRLARLAREAELLARVTHANVAVLYSFEREAGLPFLVMELVRGKSLAEVLGERRLPPDEALRIAGQVAAGLAAAHEEGVVHRDLKPGNVMLSNRGVVKVLDFGIATTPVVEAEEDATSALTSTDSRILVGTVPYMSPEQIRQQPIDRRTDSWSFGCVLYELLTGARAFARDTSADTLAAILEQEPAYDRLPDHVPTGLESLLRRCLEKDREQRLRDLEDARIELEALADPTPRPRSGAGWRAAVVALAVLAAAALAVGFWPQPDTTTAPVAAAEMLRISRLAVNVTSDATLPEELTAAVVARLEEQTRLEIVDAASDSDATLAIEIEPATERLVVQARVADSTGTAWWQANWNLPAGQFDADRFSRSLLSRMGFLLDLTSEYSVLRGTETRSAARLGIQASELLLGGAQRDLRVADQALDALDRAADIDRDFARALGGWVAVRAETADWRPWSEADMAKAEAYAAGALAADDRDPIVHVGAALLAAMQGDVEGAMDALDAAEVRGPTLFWTYMIRSELEHRIGFDDMALATATRGLEIDPYLPSLHGRVIDVHLWRGDLEAAELAVQQLDALDPGGYWAGRARARLLWERQDLAGAEEILLNLRDRFAGSPWIHRELARFYEERGDDAAAEAARTRLQALVR